MEKESSMNLKDIQNASFEVLKKLKEIFDNNNWKFYLAYGTLLGAVRHKGFIPWDDDIDVWIPRKDYEEFIEYCKNHSEELKPYELIHYSVNEKYVYPIARFSDTRYRIEYNDVKDYGLGIFVDLYPLDGSNYSDPIHKYKMKCFKRIIMSCGYNKFIPSKSKIKNLFKYILFVFYKFINLNKLLKKNDFKAQKYKYEISDKITCTTWDFDKTDYQKQWFEYNDEEIKIEFNGEMFRVPINYEEVLKKRYGNYMKLPDEKDRIPHHNYSAYRK